MLAFRKKVIVTQSDCDMKHFVLTLDTALVLALITYLDNLWEDFHATKRNFRPPSGLKSYPKTAYLAAPATFISLAGDPLLAFFLASRICDNRFPKAERRPLEMGRIHKNINKQQVSQRFNVQLIKKENFKLSFLRWLLGID